MIEFKQAQHAVKKTAMIEVWVDGKLLAAIYPNDNENGIRVMSRHVQGEPLAKHHAGVRNLRSWDFKLKEE